MINDFYMAFGVDRRGIAIASIPIVHENGRAVRSFPNHFFLDQMTEKGADFTRRMLGDIAISFMCRTHRDATRRYVFEPVAATRLFDDDSNVSRLVPDRDAVLPILVAVGLSDDGLSLETAEHDDAHQALPGTVRTTPLRELEARGPDGAATQVGNDVLGTLIRLYPAVFASYPALYDTPEVAERARLLQQEKRKVAKWLDDMENGRKPDDD